MLIKPHNNARRGSKSNKNYKTLRMGVPNGTAHVLGRWSGDKFWSSFKAYRTFYKKPSFIVPVHNLV